MLALPRVTAVSDGGGRRGRVAANPARRVQSARPAGHRLRAQTRRADDEQPRHRAGTAGARAQQVSDRRGAGLAQLRRPAAARHGAVAHRRQGRRCGAYLRGHEGRGIGLLHRLRAYALQHASADAAEANLELGRPIDDRDYSAGAQILADLGVRRLHPITNNPRKAMALGDAGLVIVERVGLVTLPQRETAAYLRTTRSSRAPAAYHPRRRHTRAPRDGTRTCPCPVRPAVPRVGQACPDRDTHGRQWRGAGDDRRLKASVKALGSYAACAWYDS